MTDAITVTNDADLSGIRLTQSKTGHVHSPRFTFPNQVTRTVRGPDYHFMIGKSVGAFMALLGVDRDEVIVSEHQDKTTDERWWSLGTKHPCELPKPKLSQRDRMLEIEKTVKKIEGAQDAIDI